MGEWGKAHVLASCAAVGLAWATRAAPGDWWWVRTGSDNIGHNVYSRYPGIQTGPLTLVLGWAIHDRVIWVLLGSALLGVFSWLARLPVPAVALAILPWTEISVRCHLDDLIVCVAAAGLIRTRHFGWLALGVAAKPTAVALLPMLGVREALTGLAVGAAGYLPFMPGVLEAGRGIYTVQSTQPVALLTTPSQSQLAPSWVRGAQFACSFLAGWLVRVAPTLVPVAAFTARQWLDPSTMPYHVAIVAVLACLADWRLGLAGLVWFVAVDVNIGAWSNLGLLLMTSLITAAACRVRCGAADPQSDWPLARSGARERRGSSSMTRR